ncbi:hypothetical protein FHS43_000459 [Streptosporangium becharense]|uniref:Uncharacterized protein n=1 Tax=Streptosporangium becharense TaxID=1816182 RepID=A0A7W9IFM5_9ACTN|nr:hypothetical protein [Streptosporangium becharense]MBB2909213.1 hypothetical protein [Streptosporangium becharense]MBB5819768.1 hypothetical protein [Streptosporangium becharense]
MGSTGISLQVSGDGDRAVLHAAIWEAARDFLDMYTGSPAYETAYSYLSEAIPHEKDLGGWGVDGDWLRWMFPDFAGCCAVSSNIWVHWLQLAFAADWDRFVQLAGQHGLEIVSERPALDGLLANDGSYVTLRGEVWSVDEKGLYGDDKHLPIADLDPDELARHAEACERCMCGPCAMLRPEPGICGVTMVWASMTSGEQGADE